MSDSANWFRRLLLPGLAFKAVVIGGGYATGRELIEFFYPSGPVGGLLGLLLTMLVWSGVCATTFVLAWALRTFDYRSFFAYLLGPFWIVFEVAYVLMMMLVLSVFAAAAGSLGHAVLGTPQLVGTLALVTGIVTFAGLGQAAVEGLFKYVSLFLYVVYAIFVGLASVRFGDRIVENFAVSEPAHGWVLGALQYSAYNVVAATVILPVLRHARSARDALTAGLLSGPLAALPAILFFVCMMAYYPQIGAEELPSNFLLARLGAPAFQLVFQAMIFAALLESGAGLVHAINERAAQLWTRRGRHMSVRWRALLTLAVLVVSVFIADRVGLIALIAKGYGISAYIFLVIFVLPLLTVGVWRIVQWFRAREPASDAVSSA